jgi:hypothetical protein
VAIDCGAVKHVHVGAAALATFGYIVSVAMTKSPFGVLARL